MNIPVELQFVEKLILYRLNKYLSTSVEEVVPSIPDLDQWQSPLARFVSDNKLTTYEAVVLLIALAPHIHPDLFDTAIESKIKNSGDFPKIGGVRGKSFRGFLPTGETALFLLTDDNALARQEVQKLFWADHLFGKKKVLWLEELQTGEPVMSGRIIMSQDYIDTFTYGKPVPPHFSMSFPAKLIQTDLSWNDLVIDKELQQQIQDIMDWLQINDQLMHEWGMESRLKKGYRTLFYGPPGTGKTFTAGLLAKYTGKQVYKIDLSMVVSKYIGETEKNLELLFARAEDKGWILFFDEADALFGKRTSVRDAHDKYANQEVSYLLQRIEDYNGLIILATNMKNNIDDAFIRRFNSILKFPFPDAESRALIWEKSFPPKSLLYKDPGNNDTRYINEKNESAEIIGLIRKYELTGGNIINVVHYAGIKALQRFNRKKSNSKTGSKKYAELGADEGSSFADKTNYSDTEPQLPVYLPDVLDGIRRELIKEGKPFTL